MSLTYQVAAHIVSLRWILFVKHVKCETRTKYTYAGNFISRNTALN